MLVGTLHKKNKILISLPANVFAHFVLNKYHI